MRSELLFDERHVLDVGMFVEIVVWRVPRPLRGSTHHFKYRLAFIVNEECVLRYDNEAGKGDHKHVAEREVPYRFTDLATLQADFRADIAAWRSAQ